MPNSFAQDRLYQAVRLLNGPLLSSRITFKAVADIGSAAWLKRKESERALIVVDSQLCETLPIEVLQALIVHELMHEVSVNDRLLHPVGRSRLLVNLALDIYLERALSKNRRYAKSLRKLNDQLLDTSQLTKQSKLADAMVFFVHSAPPFALMPRGFKTRWNQIWRQGIRWTAEDIYSMLAAIPNAKSLDNIPAAGGFQTRYSDGFREPQLVLDQPIRNRLGRPEASFTISEMSEFLEDRLSSAFRIKVQVKPHQTRNFTKGRQWIQKQSHFELGTAVRFLLGEETQAKTNYQPLLLAPTANGIAQAMSDIPQLYYENYAPDFKTIAPIYIDVSGSMQEYFESIIDFARALVQLRPTKIFCFDLGVRQSSLSKIINGEAFTGWATSFNAVLRHVLHYRPKRFFVITDDLDTCDCELRAEVRRQGIESRALIFDPQSEDYQWDRVLAIG
jgi:hypothetical protein